MKWAVCLLTCLICLRLMPTPVLAQTEATPAAIVNQPVEYYLPHPGILPDHPLYWLKMVRDRLNLSLKWRPQAKAETLLLYADKRLGAGWALIDRGKTDLGVSTLTKAEKYLERTLKLSDYLDNERLKKAVAKHQEVLLLLKDKVNDQQRSVIDQMLERFNNQT